MFLFVDKQMTFSHSVRPYVYNPTPMLSNNSSSSNTTSFSLAKCRNSTPKHAGYYWHRCLCKFLLSFWRLQTAQNGARRPTLINSYLEIASAKAATSDKKIALRIQLFTADKLPPLDNKRHYATFLKRWIMEFERCWRRQDRRSASRAERVGWLGEEGPWSEGTSDHRQGSPSATRSQPSPKWTSSCIRNMRTNLFSNVCEFWW